MAPCVGQTTRKGGDRSRTGHGASTIHPLPLTRSCHSSRFKRFNLRHCNQESVRNDTRKRQVDGPCQLAHVVSEFILKFVSEAGTETLGQ
jgi:hypothetical protein